jgi:hypothetical protein
MSCMVCVLSNTNRVIAVRVVGRLTHPRARGYPPPGMFDCAATVQLEPAGPDRVAGIRYRYPVSRSFQPQQRVRRTLSPLCELFSPPSFPPLVPSVLTCRTAREAPAVLTRAPPRSGMCPSTGHSTPLKPRVCLAAPAPPLHLHRPFLTHYAYGSMAQARSPATTCF